MQFSKLPAGSAFTLPKSKTPGTIYTKTVNKYGEPTASTGRRMFTFQPDTAVGVITKTSP